MFGYYYGLARGVRLRRTILGFDFSTQTPGIAVLPGGLSFSRASTATVQTSASTILVTGITTDVARIGDDGANHKGLVIEEARTNNAQYAQLVGNPVSTTGTPTISDITGPDGATSGRQIQDTGASAFQFQYFNPTNFSNGTSVVGSCWGKLIAGTQGTVQENGDSADLVITSANWARVVNSGTANAISPFSMNFVPTNLVAASVGTCAFYGAQYEAGKFVTELILTSGAAATRAGERLWLTDKSTAIISGQLSMEVAYFPKGAHNAYAAQQNIFFIDANNQAFINNGTVTVVVGGVSLASSNSYTFNAGDNVELWIRAGNDVPQASMRVNGGTPTVFTFTQTQQAALSTATGTMDLLCSGTTNQLTSRVRAIRFYGRGVKPGWA